MSIMKKLVSFFKPAVKTFSNALITSVAKNGGELLTLAATEAVKAAEANGGSGKDKFDAAVNSVVNTLGQKGIDAAKNAVEGAVLMAVANMKAGK